MCIIKRVHYIVACVAGGFVGARSSKATRGMGSKKLKNRRSAVHFQQNHQLRRLIILGFFSFFLVFLLD